MRDYVNEIRKCWLCSSLSYPLVVSAFLLSSPWPPPSLCRMGDPVFFSSAPGCRRPEALRHKQNTDKNTRRAMCWPLSQNSTNSHSFPEDSFSFFLSFSFTHKLRQSAKKSAWHCICTTVIILALSPECRAVDNCLKQSWRGFVLVLYDFTCVPTTPSKILCQSADPDFQIALSKKDLKGGVT